MSAFTRNGLLLHPSGGLMIGSQCCCESPTFTCECCISAITQRLTLLMSNFSVSDGDCANCEEWLDAEIILYKRPNASCIWEGLGPCDTTIVADLNSCEGSRETSIACTSTSSGLPQWTARALASSGGSLNSFDCTDPSTWPIGGFGGNYVLIFTAGLLCDWNDWGLPGAYPIVSLSPLPD